MKRSAAVVALLAGACCVGRGWGTTIDWVPTTTGLFSLSSNWSPATIPGAADLALFDVNSTYTVIFQTDITNTTVQTEDGNVTFQLAGRTYTLSNFLQV